MGREGAWILIMKNHEGYTDTTAGKAIRRANSLRFRRRGRASENSTALTYLLGEAPGFPAVLK